MKKTKTNASHRLVHYISITGSLDACKNTNIGNSQRKKKTPTYQAICSLTEISALCWKPTFQSHLVGRCQQYPAKFLPLQIKTSSLTFLTC